MALRLKPETYARWAKLMDAQEAREAAKWRPVPRSEPVPEPHTQDTDMFINGYVD